MDEFHSQCRTCLDRLKPGMECIDLFDDRMLFSVINEVVPTLKISKNDGLPQYICHICLEEIERLSQFRLRCEDTGKKLLEIYESLKLESLEINSIVQANVSEVKTIEFSYNPITKTLAPKETIKCVNCGDKFDNENELQNHIYVHKCQNSKKCELCCMTFSSKKCLKRHYTTSNHLLKTNGMKIEDIPTVRIRQYTCDRCPKSFARSDHLKNHLRSHADVNGQFHCDICFKTYESKTALKDHLMKHFGTNKALCNKCGKSFTSMANLKQHILRHDKIKEFQCMTCQKCFISKGELNSHTRTHTGVRPFVCNICEKSFSMSYSLRKHKRSHTGERPYSCSYCKKAFKIKETMKIHERIHTGEKPYSCSFCQRAFTQKNDMIKHERIHKDDRPYGCKVCGKRFIQRSTLITHEKGVHKGELF